MQLVAQDSLDNLPPRATNSDEGPLPEITPEPDVPQEDTKLTKALVDTDKRGFKKKEPFDICTFLTDSLGESVAQGMDMLCRYGDVDGFF